MTNNADMLNNGGVMLSEAKHLDPSLALRMTACHSERSEESDSEAKNLLQ